MTNPLVELILGLVGVAIMILTAAGFIWGLVEVGMLLLRIAG